MLTTTIEKLTAVLPHLSPLTAGARTRRVGNKMRFYREEAALPAEMQEHVRALLLLGATVRVYEALRILTATLADDGALVWTQKAARVNRAEGEHWTGLAEVVTVEVKL
jgi:hypothetical protein